MIYLRFALIFITSSLALQQLHGQTVYSLEGGRNVSIRGLSVVNDSVAWVSGSNGWVASTVNKGRTWKWKQLPGYEELDFRDIEAFSNKRAIVMSSGSPAVVLLTRNGGKTWEQVHRDAREEIFLDGMDFWDKRSGLIFGDPIKGQMQLLRTTNSGQSWQDISTDANLKLEPGEASFAASGTTIRTAGEGNAWIATGGMRSRLFSSADYGQTWSTHALPITQGDSSKGPFSIAFYDAFKGFAVGGDYKADTLADHAALLTEDGGKSWQKPHKPPGGFRSAVEYVSAKTLIATGTSGTDISADGGKTWQNLVSEGFHAVRRAKTGTWILLAGSNGRISTIRF